MPCVLYVIVIDYKYYEYTTKVHSCYRMITGFRGR